MGFTLSLAQTERCTTLNHLKLVRYPVTDEAVQAQGARHAVHDGEHVGAKGVLKLGVLVKVVEHHLGHGIALENDLKALARAAGGLVANVGNSSDLAFFDQFRDLDCQIVGVDLVWQLGDDQAHAALDFLNVDHGTHGDGAATRAVRVFDAAATQNGCTGGEVWPGDALHERL